MDDSYRWKSCIGECVDLQRCRGLQYVAFLIPDRVHAAKLPGFIASGNTAAIVVALCVIASWCFISDRFVIAGILSLAMSVAMKPHDSGLVLLYFLLADSRFRKRAVQSSVLTALILPGRIFWLWNVAPHWLLDWRSNLAAISAPGGMNDPRPSSIASRQWPRT